MKKMVLKLELRDDRAKQKALAAVSSLLGIDSVAVAMSDGKMTVIGSVDPVVVVGKLRKSGWPAQLLTVGPAKEERTNMVPIDPTASYNAYYNPHFYCHLPPADDNVNGCVIC